MNKQVPECLRQVIAALDIIFLFIYLAASHLPFIYSSWNYKKGIIIRRDIWIATTVLAISTIRMVGMICFIMYYVLGGRSSGVYSVSLGLRVMLALTISPLDARVTRWAFKTLKWVRRRKECLESGPQQPSTNTETHQPSADPEPMDPIPRSQQVLVAVNPNGELLSETDGSSLHVFLVTMYWTVLIVIFIAATVCSGLVMSKSQQHDLYRFHASMIWLLPPIFLMFNRCFSSAGRPSPANPSLVRPDGWYSWMIGTMVGVEIFLFSYGFNCKLRKEAITDMTDFWTQFAGVMLGWGG
ncbi:uncharacterized protein NECHADRAFT_84638 [Fusarium vanettenii 77-13-4]|uniref:Uncharacterized protein n=1 Tax=Fusarium vanettenii (strain ATCC MYA-4622 / CBS 123669 / FGSC 9596 / NRRL 45880 / 77-13-4) TaxID=660122 RepID=C7YTM9_FUSV7|nr:uncharacterized protein NECHADRAFT_84638 [Fusarium vanettenii 77-13-4]EEU44649.1 predicted protein [Fusarium vanettenii 77-13-4]